MFERYTENARRSVFYGRYEATQRGLPQIETPCLLLGILRADKDLMLRLLPGGPDEPDRLRTDVEAGLPKTSRTIAASVDLPLSDPAKRALVYTENEAKRRSHWCIEPRHLLFGLLTGGGAETACLISHGICAESIQGELAKPGCRPSPAHRWRAYWHWIGQALKL